jgi:hypothetical protein
MSKSEPIDPMTFTAALEELWLRFTANAGFDAEGHWLPTAADGSVTPEIWESKGLSNKEYFEEYLWDEALITLAGMPMVGLLRVWETDDKTWRRPPPRSVFKSAYHPDEIGRLFVDREEFEQMLLTRYPPNTIGSAQEPAVIEPERSKNVKGRRGRPRGRKYAEPDALLLIEMRSLIESGKATSPHEASLMVAHKAAGGGTEESKARRVRDAFSAENNGD